MRGYIMELGCVKGCEAPPTAPSDVAAMKLCDNNSRVVNAILGGLENFVFVKVMPHCKTTKDILGKLQIIY